MAAVDLGSSPYSLDAGGAAVLDDAVQLGRRIETLREAGSLTSDTLEAYFGAHRFEQIAESNALEGSTLSVGETELAVLQGVTISGHDPAFARDAVRLAQALDRVVELARTDAPTDIEQISEVHGLLLGDRPGSGVFRAEPVTIRGSAHRPPKTWAEVMDQMEDVEAWSRANPSLSPLIRGIVLHTWLTHVHPFIDGNGRAARAVLNLELIRGGFPVVIIRRKDRARYLEALAESDAGGDLGPIAELVLERAESAFNELERQAARHQGYSEIAEQAKRQLERRVAIWNDATQLLLSLLVGASAEAFGDAGFSSHAYDDALSVEDFQRLCSGDSTGNAWARRFSFGSPGGSRFELLAWVGYRSHKLRELGGLDAGPSLYWSVRDESGDRPWKRADEAAPGGREFTLELPNVDRWVTLGHDQVIHRWRPSGLVDRMVRDIAATILD